MAAPTAGLHERFASSRVGRETGMPVVFSSWPPFVPSAGASDRGGRRGGRDHRRGRRGERRLFFDVRHRAAQGREFTAGDAAADAPVAVVSESLAGRLWPAGRRAWPARPRNGANTRRRDRRPVADRRRDRGDVRQTYDDGDRGGFLQAEDSGWTFRDLLRSHRPAGADAVRVAPKRGAEIDRDAVVNLPGRWPATTRHGPAPGS